MANGKLSACSLEEEGYAAKGVKPERNLLAAVLARAICDAFGSAQCDKHVVRNARRWLFGALAPTRVFSFAWVVNHLDLDPVVLQHTLRSYEGDPQRLQERLGMLR